MEQSQNPRPSSSSSSRPYQFHPAKPVITDLFNLYLGRTARQKPEEPTREPPNKAQKRVTALNRDLPPPNEQFISDFEQIQKQFPDQEELRSVTESVLISLVVQCSGHSPRAEFLLFALRSLFSIGCITWDTFLPSLLSAVSAAEMSLGQGSQAPPASTSSNSAQAGMLASTNILPVSSNLQSNPASPLTSAQGIGSPAQSANEPSSAITLSPVKLNEISSSFQQSALKVNSVIRDSTISSLRQLCCKIILTGLESSLKPVTHAEILYHMLNWLVNWDQRHQDNDESDVARCWRPDKVVTEWLHSCLDVVWLLVDERKCRVPFYELLRSGLQFIENIPDDESLFTLMMEIHRRRDMMAMHMQMLDQHLHCPTFGTQRFLPLATPHFGGETITNLRYSPITYPSVLGEPLHGEDLAACIQKGTLDWDRALRCIRHALRTTPSPDWWKRVLLVAPCYRPQPNVSTPGAVFTCEMICEATIDRIVELLKLTNSDSNCWQEWLIFSDIFFFLMKSGCIDFVDFVNKLVSRLIEDDHHILRTNHVTWLLAQIIRVELVMNALNNDSRKVETTRKILSFHREDKSSDPNSPQSILLDFISSCQNLRIWSLSTLTREYLNNEQLQKGKQIDEWWRQVSKEYCRGKKCSVILTKAELLLWAWDFLHLWKSKGASPSFRACRGYSLLLGFCGNGAGRYCLLERQLWQGRPVSIRIPEGEEGRGWSLLCDWILGVGPNTKLAVPQCKRCGSFEFWLPETCIAASIRDDQGQRYRTISSEVWHMLWNWQKYKTNKTRTWNFGGGVIVSEPRTHGHYLCHYGARVVFTQVMYLNHIAICKCSLKKQWTGS